VLPVAPDRADVVVAAVHGGHQVGDFLGRVLQVGVQGDQATTPGVGEAGHDRHVLAEVAVEEDHARDVAAEGPATEILRGIAVVAQQRDLVRLVIHQEYSCLHVAV
jgi:hypothetical protein